MRLRRGGVVAFPTDTVTGLGCAADSAGGIETIFALKRRDAGKPLVLFAGEIAQIEKITGPLPARIRRLLKMVWPGAFTAVFPVRKGPRGRRRFPPGLLRGDSVAARIPAHPVPRALVRLSGGMLATTSANVSGRLPLRDAARARRLWGSRLLAVPGVSGETPSTVADLTRWPPRILREGAVSRALLKELARVAERGPS